MVGWHDNTGRLMIEIDAVNCSLSIGVKCFFFLYRKISIISGYRMFLCHTWFVPRRSSATLLPFDVSNTRISVPRSELVASRVPCKFNAIQLMVASCAVISNGAFSVLAKSTIWTWPVRRPGKASNDLLLFGHSTHNPNGFGLVSKTCNCCGWVVNV